MYCFFNLVTFTHLNKHEIKSGGNIECNENTELNNVIAVSDDQDN